MQNRKSITVLVAFALGITLVSAIESAAQGASSAHFVPVPQGQKLKVQGVVSIRSGDSFKVRAPGGAETSVLLTSDTDVTSHSRGLRGKKDYPVTYIMRGLRLQAQGVGDADGNLVADWVRFDEQDLRAAQALERQMNSPRKTGRGWRLRNRPLKRRRSPRIRSSFMPYGMSHAIPPGCQVAGNRAHTAPVLRRVIAP